MTINNRHASHIRKVEVNFIISGECLIPAQVTETVGIQPDHSGNKGDENQNRLGHVIGTHSEAFWILSTENKVESKDINDHLRYLLSRLLPHRDAILKFAENGETYFDILWQSTYLYAGTGPVIARDGLLGIAQLGARMGFDIYQIDDKQTDEA